MEDEKEIFKLQDEIISLLKELREKKKKFEALIEEQAEAIYQEIKPSEFEIHKIRKGYRSILGRNWE